MSIIFIEMNNPLAKIVYTVKKFSGTNCENAYYFLKEMKIF